MEAVVIGGGHAGLAVSQQLSQLGVDHLVLERGRIGESWRSQRWDSFALNTPTWMNRLPGESRADLQGPADGFLTHQRFAGHLDRYAGQWSLPVHEHTRVDRVERLTDGHGFRVIADGAGREAIETRSVVVASGAMNVPRIPEMAGSLPAGIHQVSALTYERPDALPPGAVLVVGAGQSGGQIVEDLLLAGRTVYWSLSAVARQPRRYRGRDTLDWLVESGFFAATTEQVADPAERNATIPLISGVGRHGHTLSVQWLADRGARLLGRITAIDGSSLLLDDTVGDCVRFGDERAARICAAIDGFIRDSGTPMPPIEPDEANTFHPDASSLHSPDRIDLSAQGIGSVVWATGVSGDFSYLPQASLDSDGRPLQQGGAGAMPGLFFVGLPWMTHRSSAILHGPMSDAGPVARMVAEHAGRR